MRVYNFHDMANGWWIGNFEPTVFRNSFFEVAYKYHHKGERYPTHYQLHATEYNLLIRGCMVICGRTMNGGDIFVIDPYEEVQPVFVDNCEVICVKVPSLPQDKVEIK